MPRMMKKLRSRVFNDFNKNFQAYFCSTVVSCHMLNSQRFSPYVISKVASPVAASRLMSTFFIAPKGEKRARISASEML